MIAINEESFGLALLIYVALLIAAGAAANYQQATATGRTAPKPDRIDPR